MPSLPGTGIRRSAPVDRSTDETNPASLFTAYPHRPSGVMTVGSVDDAIAEIGLRRRVSVAAPAADPRRHGLAPAQRRRPGPPVAAEPDPQHLPPLIRAW
ncbi:hypothetical protein [Saccharopolyspora terrae]|uniref:hypothetical protein n=1 Tax=Saccharopolyspora terrae TaxID=2530384 RepID=UPI001A9F836F|nr:hypothetical protein [Saccharopolyspora terrae]